MVGKLDTGRKLIMDLIEQSIGAFEQREELCNKLQNLESKSENEQNLHLQEMRELQRKLDHDIKLKEFFAIKSNHRVNAELEAREALHKQQQQEMADKQLSDLQDVMAQIQVIIILWGFELVFFTNKNNGLLSPVLEGGNSFW